MRGSARQSDRWPSRVVSVRAGLAILGLFGSAALVVIAARHRALAGDVVRSTVVVSTVLLVADLLLLQRARQGDSARLYELTAVVEALALSTWLTVTDPIAGPLAILGPSFVLLHALAGPTLASRVATSAMVLGHASAGVLFAIGAPQLIPTASPTTNPAHLGTLVLAYMLVIATTKRRRVFPHEAPEIDRPPRGEDLASRLQRLGRLSLDEAAFVGRELATTLAAAHDRGQAHLALDPTRIWLGADGTCMIFGLDAARSADGIPELDRLPPAALLWLAPEQVATNGATAVGPAADQFVLAGLLYLALTGTPPFAGNTSAAAIHQVLHERPARPSSIVEGLSEDVDLALAIALAKDPTDRYPDMGDLGCALIAASRGQLSPAHRARARVLLERRRAEPATLTADR